jgi:hypothetical protein
MEVPKTLFMQFRAEEYAAMRRTGRAAGRGR